MIEVDFVGYFIVLYSLIGIAWFIYVLLYSCLKNKRLEHGTMITCIFGWPVTFFGYLRNNNCSPFNWVKEEKIKRKIEAKDCIVVMDKYSNIQGVFVSNVNRDISLHNMGITPQMYKDRKWYAVLGKLEYERNIDYSDDSLDCEVSKEDTTCWNCSDKETCIYAWDPYNTEGSCLADK